MSETPKNGSMQIKDGKMRMFINDAWVDFGPAYISSDMRRVAKPINGRRNGYSPILIKMASAIEHGGLQSIQKIQGMLKTYFGCSERWMAQNCKIWHSWLGQIWQFRNCTGKKDKPVHAECNKRFRENIEKVFHQNMAA
jgi:hypothetical protein